MIKNLKKHKWLQSIFSQVIPLLAFDAKDFERRKLYQEEDLKTKEPRLTEITTFYTPLGVGVKFKDITAFKKVCLERIQELAMTFELKQKRLLYDSYSLR